MYIPGSKSISNRALILASLCRAKTTLSGILNSEDVALMIAALSKLGIQVSEDDSGKEINCLREWWTVCQRSNY